MYIYILLPKTRLPQKAAGVKVHVVVLFPLPLSICSFLTL